MPLLTRDLIWASAKDLSHIAIPSGDSVYRPGFDGVVVTSGESAFIPSGQSVWEIGTDDKPRTKANKDFNKRIDDASQEKTFIFVTQRYFDKKEEWCEEKRRLGIWKDVRVLDCDDLEDWLSQTPSVAFNWIERVAHIAPEGTLPLVYHWNEWKEAVDGYLSPSLVLSSYERIKTRDLIWDWLEEGRNILRLKTFSPKEGLLFIAAALLHYDGLGHWLVRGIHADNENTLRQLAANPHPQLIITSNDNIGIAKNAIANGHKYCVLTPHNYHPEQSDLAVVEVPLRVGAFEATKALTSLGMAEGKADKLLRSSGRMLMALRNEITGEHPCWATPELKAIMATIIFASGWSEERPEDRIALERLSGLPYEKIENNLKRVLVTPEPPIQYISPYWKLISPMDVWRCLGPNLTQSDFEKLESVIIEAFTVEDPVMDLPEEQRAMAPLFGKTTPYSNFIRNGLLQSLLIISIFGEQFRISGISSPSAWVDRLIGTILTQCKDRKKWDSLSPYYRLLAEASPNTFLNELERKDINTPEVLTSIFTTAGDAMGMKNAHVTLMWALEIIAWQPEHLARAAQMLVKLHSYDPGGNHHPRPADCFGRIFNLVIPQTNMDAEHRLELLEALLDKNPTTVPDLLLQLIPSPHRTTFTRSVRPLWREVNDGVPSTYGDIWRGMHQITSLLVEKAENDGRKWAAIIENYEKLRPDSRKLVQQELDTSTQSRIKHHKELRDSLRATLHRHRSYPDTNWAIPEQELRLFQEVYDRLEPADTIERYEWLFGLRTCLPMGQNQNWQETEQEKFRLQTEAAHSIIKSKGIAGIVELAKCSENLDAVAKAYVEICSDIPLEVSECLLTQEGKLEDFSRAFVFYAKGKLGSNWIHETLTHAQTANWGPQVCARLCLTLPPCVSTWTTVADLGENCEREYWRMVNPYVLISPTSPEEDIDMLWDKLFDAGRSSTMISIACQENMPLSYNQRVKALTAFIESPEKERTSGHEIREIFARLYEAEEKNENELIGLEWVFSSVFDLEATQLTIHQKMASDVNAFKEIISINTDNGADANIDMVWKAEKLFDNWQTVPGSREDASIDEAALRGWIAEARSVCKNIDENGMVDSRIGGVLAHSPCDKNGLFPCLEVRNTIEELSTEELEGGFVAGIHNKRGTWTRSANEGGKQERAIAKQYREWAKECQVKWPRVARLLQQVAESYSDSAIRMDKDVKLRDMKH